jgi:hypothetical protein
MHPTRLGILVFTAAALAGPWYTVEEYGWIGNVISQLGAQNTPNAYVMVIGFLALGLGIVVDGVRRWSRPLLPFVAFGLLMALAGLFAHKPISPTLAYSEAAHGAHGALATLAGVSITIGLVWQAVYARARRSRVIAIALAVLCLALPLCMLALPDAQGLIQRLMYLLVFTWLWIHYPGGILATRQPEETGAPT